MIVLTLIHAIPSRADVLVVDNSPPDNVTAFLAGVYPLSPQYIANPFTLASTTTLSGFNFWGNFYAEWAHHRAFTINFYANNGVGLTNGPATAPRHGFRHPDRDGERGDGSRFERTTSSRPASTRSRSTPGIAVVPVYDSN